MSSNVLDSSYMAAAALSPVGPGQEDIFSSVQLEADIQRVLHALALPEYIEAWMQFPDTDRIECHSDRRSFDRFRIDLFSAGVCRESIFASCLLSKPNRVTYLWKFEGAVSTGSIVEMRLWKYQSRCSLKLKHSGLATPRQREWHSEMWLLSLDKLCELMQGTGLAAFGPLRVGALERNTGAPAVLHADRSIRRHGASQWNGGPKIH
jgi:hypothetical protein